MKKYSTALKNLDIPTLIVLFLLALFSLTMLESTVYNGGIVFARVVLIQMISYILGFILVFIIAAFDYKFFEGAEKYLYIFAVVLLLSVYIPGLGMTVYGSRAWINLGFTTLQPSEFVKILFVMINAGYLSSHRNELNTFKGFLKAFLYACPIIVVVLKEDLGSALVYMVMWLFMVFFAGTDLKVLLKSALIVLLAIPVAYRFLDDYQKGRIEAFLHPDNLSLSGNYQVWQSKVAIGSGGVWGKGLFHGMQKTLDFIPVQQSDFIFSVVCEELGLIGGISLLILYGVLISRMFSIIYRIEDMYGALIIIGFIGMLLFQVFENIAMTMGFMPVTGITLPFVSGGGTSVLASMISMGVVLNIGIRSKVIEF